MGDTSIEWTHGNDGKRGATWNPIAGCSIVSPGCTRCYAMRMAARLELMHLPKYAGTTHKVNGHAVWTGKINLDEEALTIPLTTRKPTTWFVNSMSDLFHEGVPFDFVDKVFAVMALTPHHTYQILTKRPERMAKMLNEADFCTRLGVMEAAAKLRKAFPATPSNWEWPLPNVWLGTSIEDRKRLDERAMALAKCPAAVTFWSAEPLLEDLGNIRGYLEQGVRWVIVGGESGPGSRPCNIGWVRSIVEQCQAAGVAVFVKQLGSKPYHQDNVCSSHEAHGVKAAHDLSYRIKDSKGGDIAEFPEDLRVREFPKVQVPS
jgi:protein gp37